jgi:hypothetical protein
MKAFAFVCSFAVLLGCGDPPAEAPTPRENVGEAGVLTFHLDLEAAVPAGAVDATLTITRDGTPVTGAYVWVSATMPSHAHASSALRAEELGGGDYAIDGLELGMPGEWALDLDAEADGIEDHIRFEVFVE